MSLLFINAANGRDKGLKWKYGPAGVAHPGTNGGLEPMFPCSFWTKKCFVFSKQESAELRLLTASLFLRLNLELNRQILEPCGGDTQNKATNRGGRGEPHSVPASEPRKL